MRHRFYPFEKKPFHFFVRGTYTSEQKLLKAWDRSTKILRDLGNRHILNTHAFVLMSNHCHHLWSPSDASAIEAFGELAKEVLEIVDCDKPTWDDSISEIDSFYQFQQVYKYIYRNPVDGGLVRRVEDYRFSTIQSVLGNQPNISGLLDPFGLIFDQTRMLDWLNAPLSQNEMAARTVNRCRRPIFENEPRALRSAKNRASNC
jgi:REP element-mobilizing transposase RayT